VNQPTVDANSGHLLPDQIVAERYRVGGLLGEGGMGAVYRVEHIHMRKTFALKVLHAEMCRVPEVLARFEREAVAAGAIEHPNVAAATDFGRLADGSFFLVLEYVDGRSLREEIKKGPIPAKRAIAILRGIVGGVAAAHAKGIVHRDLKPENVMLVVRDADPDFPKVLDFGIAKIEPDASASAKTGEPILTRMGTLIGTPDYMSPEQALGQGVDARSDLYSLGVIFYEMLAGVPPFRGDAVEVIQQHLLKPPPPLANVDPAVMVLIEKMMTKTVADRIQTADDLLARIDALPTGAPVAAPKRRRWLIAVGLLFVPVIVFFAVIVRWSGDDDKETALPVDPDPQPAVSVELDMPAIPAWEPATPSTTPTPTSTTTAATTVAKTKPAPRSTGTTPPKKKHRIYIPPPSEWFR
jgi:serine/threonine-protein kinase